jgi:hypothetical protein
MSTSITVRGYFQSYEPDYKRIKIMFTEDEFTENYITNSAKSYGHSPTFIGGFYIKYNGKSYFYSIDTSKDFISTYNGNYPQGPIGIKINDITIPLNAQSLINSGNYVVNVNLQYSIYVSTTSLQIPSFTWVSTLGAFNSLNTNTPGISVTSRIGNNQYSQINSSLTFLPYSIINTTQQIPNHTSKLRVEFWLSNTGSTLPDATVPYFDIYMSANNNISFTLIPTTSYSSF